MNDYFEVIVDSRTGERSVRPFTQEEIDAHKAKELMTAVPESITRRQCAMQLFSIGMITGDEGIAMTRSGIPPVAVQAFLAALPEPDLTMAMMDFAATSYFRDNPLLAALMTANNMTEERVDQFFIEASKR